MKDKFLKQNLPELTQEETENLCYPTSQTGIKYVIKTFPQLSLYNQKPSWLNMCGYMYQKACTKQFIQFISALSQI